MGFLTFWRPTNQNNSDNARLRATQPYNSIVALEAPIKGSYPVAGNGPNVLEEIQRTRAERQSMTSNITASPSNASRRRDHAVYRPRTAPQDDTPGGGHNRPKSMKSMKSTRGRTLSGFSMKTPPSIFGRRNSINQPPPLPTNPTPPIPQVYSPSPPGRDIKTYVPTTGIANAQADSVPPYAQQHNRNMSMASKTSHKSYVDILDAHSSIKKTQAASLQRTKASGGRDYGEDVADRNIKDFGAKKDRESRLDLSSPEFSYLKSIYAPRRGTGEPNSRAGSALGHLLGTDGRSGDDSQPASGHSQPRTSTSVKSGTRPASIYPPRVDSASAAAVAYGINGNSRSHDDHRATKARAMSPLSSDTASTAEESSAHYHRQPLTSTQSLNGPSTLPSPPIPERGRTRPTSSRTDPARHINPPPVPPPSQVRTGSRSRQISTTRPGQLPALIPKQVGSMSNTATTALSGANGASVSRKPSITYSAFPGPENGRSPSRPATGNASRRPDMVVEGASQPISLEGIVDLKDSVDTEVITKTLPAVVHEHVTPTRHEIRSEVITREIHHHNVYHRILPVIETEILPTKHYVKGEDGKTLIEIPESMVHKHKLTGRLDQNWHISKPGPSGLANGLDTCDAASNASSESAPDGPIIGLARGEPRSRPRGNSKASNLTSKSREPVLSSQKESISKDGVPRTEYVWRHPPVFENAIGETQPIGPSMSQLSLGSYTSDEEDFGAMRSPAKDGEELLFRDSGYGSGGTLPGLKDGNPAATKNSLVPLGRVVEPVREGSDTSSEGEATKALKRLREKRNMSKRNVNDLETGMGNMSVK